MRHSESSPDLNSIPIATFLPSSPLSGGICNIGVIFNDCHFLFLCRSVIRCVYDPGLDNLLSNWFKRYETQQL